MPQSTGASVVVHDSAGVTIVESRFPQWEASEGWSIEPEPVLRIGEVDGDDPYVFTEVTAAYRTRDGTITIVEWQSGEIRIFDDTGRHLRTLGGRGEGPSEFPYAFSTGFSDPDTIVAYDVARRRLVKFSVDGQLLSGAPAGSAEGAAQLPQMGSPYDWRVVSSRLLFGTELQMTEDGPLRELRRHYFVAGEGTSPTRFHSSEPVLSAIVDGVVGISNPLHPRDHFTARGGQVARAFVSTTSGGWEVLAFDSSGALGEVMRAAIPRLAIDPEMEERARSRAVDGARDRADRTRRLQALARLPAPDSAPAIGGLIADEEGNLWVRRWDRLASRPNAVYDVIDLEGRWLGPVMVPSSVGDPLTIGTNFMLVRTVDELGVQGVALHRLRRN